MNDIKSIQLWFALHGYIVGMTGDSLIYEGIFVIAMPRGEKIKVVVRKNGNRWWHETNDPEQALGILKDNMERGEYGRPQ